jgi:hypothetical protein
MIVYLPAREVADPDCSIAALTDEPWSLDIDGSLYVNEPVNSFFYTVQRELMMTKNGQSENGSKA